MSARVLCVDDEQRVLEGLELHLGMVHDLTTATSGAEGLALIDTEEPFDVVVSDMQMPGMDGAAFLKAVQQRTPQTMRILLTGHADLSAALRAINEGGIFRFLTKPCNSDLLLRTVEEATEVRRLRLAERDLLERTVGGCVEMLSEVMGVAAPQGFARAQRIRSIATRLCTHDAVAPERRWEVDVAALLSQLGTIAVPPEVLSKGVRGAELNDSEEKLLAQVPEIGAKLLEKVPRLEGAANLLRHMNPNDALAPWAECTDAPELSMLRIANWMDRALVDGKDWAWAVKRVERVVGPEIAALLGKEPRADRATPQAVRVTSLRPGMLLAADLRTRTGQCVVREGAELTHALILRLRAFSDSVGLEEPIAVFTA